MTSRNFGFLKLFLNAGFFLSLTIVIQIIVLCQTKTEAAKYRIYKYCLALNIEGQEQSFCQVLPGKASTHLMA